MSATRPTVEFRLPPTRTIPKPPPDARAERQRQERAARKARNLALAYWIDGLVRSGEIRELAAVARMCGVSRARVSHLTNQLMIVITDRERILLHAQLTARDGISARPACRLR